MGKRKQRKVASSDRRNALKGIAAYIGDKAANGAISVAAGVVIGRLTAPSPSGTNRTV
jgi:hypothetical protein